METSDFSQDLFTVMALSTATVLYLPFGTRFFFYDTIVIVFKYSFTTRKIKVIQVNVEHTQWLLLAKETGDYYSITTRQFGGEGDVRAAINARQNVIALTLIGARSVESQAVTLSRNMYPLPKEELDKFVVYPYYQERVENDARAARENNDPNLNNGPNNTVKRENDIAQDIAPRRR